MITTDQVTQLKEVLTPAQRIFIMVGAQPSYDQVASATALSLALGSEGKEVLLLSPRQLGEEFTGLEGLEQVRTELGHQNLHVTFDYSPTSVDKVSYHIDEDAQKFVLVIKPQKGQQPLDTSAVEFTYAGAEADVIVLVGVHQLETLEQLYLGYEEVFQSATVVTLHSFEPEIGTIKLNSSGFSSMSEAAGTLLLHLNMTMDERVSTNILAGIEQASDGFKSLSMTADTFDLVARLMRNGARRLKRSIIESAASKNSTTALSSVLKNSNSSQNEPSSLRRSDRPVVGKATAKTVKADKLKNNVNKNGPSSQPFTP